MASDTRRRAFPVAVLAVTALSALMIGSTPVHAALAWWSPVGLRGIAVTRVSAVGDTIKVRTGSGATLTSSDAGKTFAPANGNESFPPTGTVVVGNDIWSIDSDGVVRHAAGGGASAPDPGAPRLGAGADLIASPAALPGVVVAVGTDGAVWRRGQDGDWKQALLLLPQSLFQGVPRITSLTAFTQPLSGAQSPPDAIYLGTDGYGVLISTDGGDDWIRAGAGLPDAVFSLSADSARRAVYAGTSDGLWVHVLQQFPAPPAYRDAALVWRWLGIGAITIVAAALTLLSMMRLTPRRPTGAAP
jgi:hypothetical protein